MRALIAFVILAACAILPTDRAAEKDDGWLEIDYSDLVDQRALTHSGEPVGVVLRRLGGRPLPPPGQRRGDRLAHSLLDPLLEPYAFVVLDAVEAMGGVTDPPFVEVGRLWHPGEAQPAWVELLRARRYLVESDGQGRMRVVLPLDGSQAPEDSAEAARQAYRRAWPVLRLVFAAERARRGGDKPLEVEVRAYRHLQAASRFYVGRRTHGLRVADTRSDGNRPPLDLKMLETFLSGGLLLEGARLEADGSMRLFGSRPDSRPQLLGRELTLGDLAVAYRAVFHGGLAEPYMSLDRGFSPQMSLVNYGGRLRDTSLGLVSLLCDIRFKTFSLGLDIAQGLDLRETIRREVPEFRTHLERFAEDPRSREVSGQQTRLWFYPDRVDMTVSAQGDVLAMRRVRMSAASERVEQGGGSAAQREDPPWTRATVAAIDGKYDALSAFFPELADLDQVVRMLSLFTWLRQARADGLLTPDLDELLGVELPPLHTPRTFPQQLAFNALPENAAGAIVDVFDRVDAAQGLENLNAAGIRPLPAPLRLRRAIEKLDPQDAQSAALLQQIRSADASRMDVSEIDLLAHRAERLRMHNTVLSTLNESQRSRLAARASENLRVFSVGIGGLDLDMGQALQRARGRSLDLLGGGAGMATEPAALADQGRTAPGERRAVIQLPRDEWRREPKVSPARVPAHGLDADAESAGFIRGGKGADEKQRFWLTVHGADGPEVSARRLVFGAKNELQEVERLHEGRLLRYRFEGDGSIRAVRQPAAGPDVAAGTAAETLPPNFIRMRLNADGSGSTGASPAVALRLEASEGRRLEADFPRATLQRLVAGRAADLSSGKPLSGLAPLPPQLGQVETLMVMQEPWQIQPPWAAETPALPGEEDAPKVARALNDWWRSEPTADSSSAAVVGTDMAASPARWSTAPRPGAKATLWLPADAFPGESSDLRRRLAEAWSAGPVVTDAATIPQGQLLVLVSNEPPGIFASRLRRIAEDPTSAGRLLAAWSLSGPVRSDLPASLLAASKLAGLGLAQASIIGMRRPAEELGGVARALQQASGGFRIERLPGPFVWYF